MTSRPLRPPPAARRRRLYGARTASGVRPLADLVGFTTLAEGRDAEEVRALQDATSRL